jgi:hypothetical protein
VAQRHQNHFEDLKAFTTKTSEQNGTIRTNKPTDEEVQGIVTLLSNQDEVKNYQIKW